MNHNCFAANGYCSCDVCILWVCLCIYTYICVCAHTKCQWVCVFLENCRHLGWSEHKMSYLSRVGPHFSGRSHYYKCDLKSRARVPSLWCKATSQEMHWCHGTMLLIWTEVMSCPTMSMSLHTSDYPNCGFLDRLLRKGGQILHTQQKLS